MATNNATNSSFPLSATLGGLGLASPTAHGILVGEGSSAVTPIVLAAGQVLIGTTSGDPSAATLTQGSGITITSVTGSITIAATGGSAGGGFTWVDETSTSATLAAGTGYAADNAALVTFTLPATSAFGDTYKVIYKGAGGWRISQNAGQNIQLGNVTSTTGTSGFIASSATGDCVELTCTTASTTWEVTASMGNITYN
jgi:hypothetical protein